LEFVNQAKTSTPELLKKVKYLPLFVFGSTHDLALASKKKWGELSEL
jgi:hypothetical protein